ncbi:MAG: orotate phosphoribosyltransferase [Candidatus Bathyarchaeia archaeon]
MESDASPFKKEVVKILARTGALRFGIFTLSSGRLSPYYIDLRVIPSLPAEFERIMEVYEGMARGIKAERGFDAIAGIPTAGMPFASVLAFKMGAPFVYVRREAKAHGREKRIEGILSPGSKVLLVDDLITTGNNLASAADSIKAEGGIVEDALVLIDREEGGEGLLKGKGIRLNSFLRISEIARMMLDMGAISEEEYEAIIAQSEGPPQRG